MIRAARSLPTSAVFVAASLAFASLVGACSESDDPATPGPTSDDADVKSTASCVGTFRFLQKDAYKSTAGRSSPLWPPHTTTQLDIACGDAGAEVPVGSSFQANHGTEPSAKDANGDVILVETKTLAVAGKRAQLDALAAAYDACSCEAETKFLSMTDVQDEAVQKVVAELVTYAGTYLVCTGDKTTEQVVGLLENGDLSAFLDALSSCSFEPGQDFEKGFDEALGKLLEASSTTLAGYHVCNNDAALQEQLITTFQTTGKVEACDATSILCRGPRWFYTP
jgi:hypothetical protein